MKQREVHPIFRLTKALGVSASTGAALLTASAAMAAVTGVKGGLELESTGYSQAMFHSLNLYGEGETTGRILEASGMANFWLTTTAGGATRATYYDFELNQAYLATSPALLPGARISLGRKQESWSRMDEIWELGLWQPRFRWDTLNPEQVGLTGLFFETEGSLVRFTAFASPGFIPERGTPMELRGDEFQSYSPFARTPPKRMSILGFEHRLRYQIDMPSYSDLLLNWGGAVNLRVGKREGPWGSLGFAHKPMNQVLLAFDPFIPLTGAPYELDVTLHPRVAYHSLASIEGGYEWRDAGVWASLTGEAPRDSGVTARFDSQRVAAARVFAAGFQWKPSRFNFSYIHVSGGNAPDSGPDTDGRNSNFEQRFPFQNALSLSVEPALGRGFNLRGRLLTDVGNSGWWLSGGVDYRFGRGWKASLSGDLIASLSDKTDLLSLYRGNDRLQAGVSYAF